MSVLRVQNEDIEGVNMGATFRAFEDTGRAHDIAYSSVSRMRRYLLEMLNLQDMWDAVWEAGIPERDQNERWSKLLAELDRIIVSDEKMCNVACGVKAFIDHSDCDGCFFGDDCENISEAFSYLLRSSVEMDGIDRTHAVRLQAVFQSVSNGGVVMIT